MNQNPYAPPTAPVDIAVNPESVVRPATATWAIRLLWANIVIGLPGAIYGMLHLPPEAMSLGKIFLVITLVFTVLFMLLWIWFIVAAGRGRNWARIVLAVLIVISTVYTLIMFRAVVHMQAAWQGGVAVAQILVDIAVVVLFFLPATNAWYRAVRDSQG